MSATLTSREIRALITLLGDEDVVVQRIARERLLGCGEAANKALQRVAARDAEGRIRIEARLILEQNRLARLTRELKGLSVAGDFDLEAATFILAQIEYPEIDLQAYKHRVDDLASDAVKRLSGVGGERERVELLGRFLFEERGFKGNAKSYYDPENSYINRVLDRCLGIPISLSALYLFVANRLELPVHGVAFPGHFLLKYDIDSDFIFIDAFNRGQILSIRECAQFLKRMGFPFADVSLMRADSKDILARMIRNLVLIYSQNNQHHKIETLERIFSDLVKK